MRNRKFIPILLVAFLTELVYLSAGIAHANDGNKAAGKIYTVAYAQDNMANDWRAAQVKQFQEFFKPYPHIQFIYTDGKGSTAKQISDIEDLLHSKIDVLITSPRDARAMTPVVKKVYGKGIPVVLVTRKILTSDFTSFIAPDDEKIAQQAAHYLAGQLNGKGKILVIRGLPTATTAIARTRGFLSIIDKYPDLSIASILDGNYLRGDAIKVMQTAIDENIDFDAIYAQSDSMAAGVRLVLEKAKVDPKNKFIVGIDYIKEAQSAIKQGKQLASFTYPLSVKEAGEVVLRIIRGEQVPKYVTVNSQLITIDNVDQITPIL